MALQVNIFEAGSVPTAQEFVTLINELNTSLDESVTLTGEQSITGVKTFLGSKLLKFKQSVSADKLGFTLYDYQSKEVGNFEYDNKNNFRLLALGNYFSATNQEVECNIGFKIYNKLQGAAYRLLCPLAGNAKNSIPTLSETYTNFYIPLVFTNGAVSVTADNGGKVDLSTLIGSGSGDVSGLATVATTGDYNDLLNLPTLFSGDYADLTNKPTIPTNLSDLSDDSTHRLVTDALISTWNSKSDFSGSYNDLTDKPTIPNAQVNSDWNSSSGVSQILNKPNLATVATTGSYNDLSDKPTIPTVPTISTNITSDAASDTKTASPKAVKDFVEGKGYLTQHQDISGKADQTDLEALEDRVETLEQSSGGGTTQYSYLKLIPDLDAYTSEAPIGEIVKYIGQSNGQYTRGWDYEKVSNIQQGRGVTSIVYTDDVSEALKQAVNSLVFPLLYDNEQVPVYYFSLGSTPSSPRFASVGTKTPAVGDPIFACDGSGVYHVTKAYTVSSKYNIYIDHPTYTSNYVLNLNKTFFKWHDSNGDTVLLRHMESASGSGYHLTNEDVFIEKDSIMYFGSDNGKTQAVYDDLQIPLWQPIIIPSSIQTDVELSSSSHYPVENATLYDELRVEEAGSAETTGSASVIKSLKAKVMELEAQIAQISAQLQNIASN